MQDSWRVKLHIVISSLLTFLTTWKYMQSHSHHIYPFMHTHYIYHYGYLCFDGPSLYFLSILCWLKKRISSVSLASPLRAKSYLCAQLLMTCSFSHTVAGRWLTQFCPSSRFPPSSLHSDFTSQCICSCVFIFPRLKTSVVSWGKYVNCRSCTMVPNAIYRSHTLW